MRASFPMESPLGAESDAGRSVAVEPIELFGGHAPHEGVQGFVERHVVVEQRFEHEGDGCIDTERARELGRALHRRSALYDHMGAPLVVLKGFRLPES